MLLDYLQDTMRLVCFDTMHPDINYEFYLHDLPKWFIVEDVKLVNKVEHLLETTTRQITNIPNYCGLIV